MECAMSAPQALSGHHALDVVNLHPTRFAWLGDVATKCNVRHTLECAS